MKFSTAFLVCLFCTNYVDALRCTVQKWEERYADYLVARTSQGDSYQRKYWCDVRCDWDFASANPSSSVTLCPFQSKDSAKACVAEHTPCDPDLLNG